MIILIPCPIIMIGTLKQKIEEPLDKTYARAEIEPEWLCLNIG
jgi:hypothetical protein